MRTAHYANCALMRSPQTGLVLAPSNKRRDLRRDGMSMTRANVAQHLKLAVDTATQRYPELDQHKAHRDGGEQELDLTIQRNSLQ